MLSLAGANAHDLFIVGNFVTDNCVRRLFLSVLKFYGPVNPMGSCRARSVYLTTCLLGRLSSKRYTSTVHILSPETDNCPS